MTSTFPKTERLCSKIGIDELFANGEARRSGGFTVKCLRIHVGAENFPPLPKLLISVPKRFQKRAVDRNRTKRLIREVYRKYKHLLARVCNPCQNVGTDEDVRASVSNIHALAIIYASAKVPEYTFVEEHLSKLLEKIK